MLKLLVIWFIGNAATWLGVASTLHPADSTKGKRRYWLGFISSSLLTLGMVYYQYAEDKYDKVWNDVAATQREEADARWKKEQARLQKQLLINRDEIKGLSGDEAAMQRSIATKNELVNQLVTRDIDPAIEEYYKTLPLQLRTRAEGLDVDKKIYLRYEKRMQAIYRLFVSAYDRWVQTAREKGQVSGENQSSEFSPIEIGPYPSFRQIRWTQLANGNAIFIQSRPATVADGKLSQGLWVFLSYQQPGGGMQLLGLTADDSGYHLVNNQPTKLSFDSYEKNSSEPADEDMEFLKRIVVAMNQAMGYVIREVEATKPKPAENGAK